MVSNLQELERRIAEFRRGAPELAAAIQSGDLARTLQATQDARHAFDSIAATTRSLRRQVVYADGLGERLESLGELALRAVQIVIVMEVCELCHALHQAPPARARSLFGGRFRNIEDVTWFVYDRFRQINELWVRFRGSSRASANRVLYRAATSVAQRWIRELADDPDLARFLHRGVALSRWPEVQRPCSRIVAAFSICVDAELDRELFTHPQPMRSAGIGAEVNP